MLYEKLTLDQFETALKESNFTATKDEITKIRNRVFRKLVLSTVKLALEDAMMDPEVKSGDELNLTFTLDNVFERKDEGENNENVSRAEASDKLFYAYNITHKSVSETIDFNEAA